MQARAGLVSGRVVDVSLLGEVDHAKDDFSILGLPEVYVLSNYRVEKIVISVTLSDEFRCEDRCQLLSNREQLLHVNLWRSVNDCRESIVHIFWRSELLDLRESSIDLVAHSRNNIVDRDQALFVDQSLSPNLSIDLIA